jgi:hypothetical protein
MFSRPARLSSESRGRSLQTIGLFADYNLLIIGCAAIVVQVMAMTFLNQGELP